MANNTNEVVEVVDAEVVEAASTKIASDACALTVIPPRIDGNDTADEFKVSEADKYAYILLNLIFHGEVPSDHTVKGFRAFVRSVEKCTGVGKFSYVDAAVHYFTKCKEGEKFLSPEMKAEMEKKTAEREAAKAKRAEERKRKAEERKALGKAKKAGKKFNDASEAVAWMNRLNSMFSQTEFQF